ncbi:hypothetical protein BIWAKO_00311 [Bosea sp. BIWAKO-01]|nr:hypothetical protein BIWAKO_00311 [Bosea sp. BIWAKO-01]
MCIGLPENRDPLFGPMLWLQTYPDAPTKEKGRSRGPFA